MERKKVEISELQLRNCLEYRELYLDLKVKVVAANVGRMNSDSLLTVSNKKYNDIVPKLKQSKAINWILGGVSAILTTIILLK
ncbi:hypothetical protein GCM10011514_06580 [Emticicia aquatilis]|uniref:Uncharacterized protein n=1 Tax=Emticicia aquatilis TaxID=1537369 RepID=A0A916YHN7_9BACT|nr:hypothetical protein [Emticicia aquatilis]GGD45235.1 hypothetical protein GCM10011514_06580 [Emticicia aquatilis]